MTSHISVSSTASTTTGTGLSSSSKPTSSPLGAFGAVLDAVQAVASIPANAVKVLDGASKSTETAAAVKTGFAQVSADATAKATAAATATTDTQTASVSDSAANLLEAIEKLLSGNSGTPAADNTVSAPLAATADTPAPVAAAADGTTDTTAGTPPKLMRDLVAALAELNKAEKSGQPVTQDLLKKVKKAVDAVANFLQTQQPVVATPAAADGPADAVAAVGNATSGATGTATPATTAATTDPTAPAPDLTTTDGQAKAAAADTAKATLGALDTKLADLSTATAKIDPDLANKLDALAKTLNPATVSADTLNQLGLNSTETNADPQLTTAINALATGKVQTTADVLQPTLAAPQLKLPTGSALGIGTTPPKTGGIEHQPTATISAAAIRPATDTRNPAHTDSNPKADDKTSDRQQATTTAATVTAAVDKAPDTSPSTTTPSAQATAAVSATSGVTVSGSASATTQAAQAAYTANATSQINLPQMAFEIARHAQQGTNHFQIRLDPADLGRVDVRLAIDNSGAVTARMSVERPETLDMLRRDAGQLGQALNQAGFDSSKTNLQFSLSQNPFTRQDQGSQQPGSNAIPTNDDGDDVDAIAATAPAVSLYRGVAAPSGLNLIV